MSSNDNNEKIIPVKNDNNNPDNTKQSKSKNKKKKFNKFHHNKKNDQQKKQQDSVLREKADLEKKNTDDINPQKKNTDTRTEEKREKKNHLNSNTEKKNSDKKVEKKVDKNTEIEYLENESSFEEQNESKLNEFRNSGLTGETVEIVGVKFKQGGKLYYFSPGEIKFSENDYVIVETVRGLEMGFVAVPNKEIDTGKIVSQLKSVVRAATKQDLETHRQNKVTEEKAKGIFAQKAAERGLEMQLMDVELTFDNSKLIFYFIAEGRVDFRELVKDLAGIFHTRIELRQIGVRDEAKQLGGLGICGQPFCCKRFLSDFPQVSIKMAKDQNLSLSSSKISGTCGRLMCCLSYEQKVYEMEYATFPRVDSVVITPAGKGVITESNFLNGIIKVRMNSEGLPVIKTFTAKDIKVIGHVKPTEEVPDDVKKLED